MSRPVRLILGSATLFSAFICIPVAVALGKQVHSGPVPFYIMTVIFGGCAMFILLAAFFHSLKKNSGDSRIFDLTVRSKTDRQGFPVTNPFHGITDRND